MVSCGCLRNGSGSGPKFLGPGGVRGLLGPSPRARRAAIPALLLDQTSGQAVPGIPLGHSQLQL